MLGPTWMDDLAICISGPSAIDLERKAALTAGILLETCMEHGVTPNLTRGKTELLLALRGKAPGIAAERTSVSVKVDRCKSSMSTALIRLQ